MDTRLIQISVNEREMLTRLRKGLTITVDDFMWRRFVDLGLIKWVNRKPILTELGNATLEPTTTPPQPLDELTRLREENAMLRNTLKPLGAIFKAFQDNEDPPNLAFFIDDYASDSYLYGLLKRAYEVTK